MTHENFVESKTKTCQSFLKHRLNYISTVSKHNRNYPYMCHEHQMFFERVDSHWVTDHQKPRRTPEHNKGKKVKNSHC